MRKSKLYLSVLASAAMIMSSSVVTMAAETDGTDTTAAATEETTTAPETEAPAEEAPETEIPAEEVPDAEVPAEEVPDAEVPAEEVPDAEVPAEEVPDAEAPAEEVPDAEAPAEEVPDAEVPAEEVPAEEEGTVINENEAGQKATSEELGNWEWNEEKGKWQFVLESGDYLGGGIWEIDGTPYAFDKDGYMVTGWFTNEEDGQRYYFNSNGAMRLGWLQDGGSWYYFDTYWGYMINDAWEYINGEAYYFNADGKMVTGWFFDEYVDEETGEVIGGEWYYLNSDGTMYDDGWLQDGGSWYFLDRYNGYMYRNMTTTIDGIERSFDGSGRLITGRWYFDEYTNGEGVVTDGTWYYLNADGTRYKGWLSQGGRWYYLDENTGIMYENGTYYIDGQRWLFNGSGQLTSGWYFAEYRDYETGEVTGGTWYYAKADGTIYEGWLNQGGTWYYLREDSGAMIRDGISYIEENDEYFAFNASGVMQTGWYFDAYYKTDENGNEVVAGGEWYYFNASGYRQYGWIWDGTGWFYLNKYDGFMYSDICDVAIDGQHYAFNASGKMITGWYFDSWTYEDGEGNEVLAGNWYYFNSSGAMQKGWIWDGTGWYFLDRATGHMTRGGWYYIDGERYLFNASGKMLTGDQWDENAQTWLYLNSDGSGFTGWRWAEDADGVGHWYYYEDAFMYRGGTYYIAEDGRYANFDADGVWTGYSPEPAEPAEAE